MSFGQKVRAQGGRRAVTGKDGRFIVQGVADGLVAAIAEKGGAGRSWPTPIGTDKQRAAVLLKLRPYGRIHGHVEVAVAAPQRLIVGTTPRGTGLPSTAFDAMATVDRRGQFAFDRLPAGHYLIGVLAGLPFGAGGFHVEEVDVVAGRDKTVTLDLRSGPKLTVVVRGLHGQTLPGARVPLLPGGGTLPGAGVFPRYFSVSRHGAPAVLPGVAPGRYRMCLSATSRDLRDPKITYAATCPRPAGCRPIVVAPAPAEQTFTITAKHLVEPASP